MRMIWDIVPSPGNVGASVLARAGEALSLAGLLLLYQMRWNASQSPGQRRRAKLDRHYDQSNWISTISGVVPSRSGGPQVPAP